MLENIPNVSTEEMKRGYIERDGVFTCLICDRQMEKGVVYSEGGSFYEAERFMRMHIEREHGTVFENLLTLDKRWTGLSEHQSRLLKLFYDGKSDADIQAELGIGSGATIRAHRFTLKEKEKQAKVFLALMALLKEKSRQGPAARPSASWPRREKSGPAKAAAAERFFQDGRLRTLSIKDKNKPAVIAEVAKRFQSGVVYTEKEVNEVLLAVHEDYAILRRYLVDYGFLERKADGSAYWVAKEEEAPAEAEEAPLAEESEMDRKEEERRKELVRQYKDLKSAGGVYRITNTANGKVFVGSTPNLKTVADASVAIDRCAFRSAKLLEDLRQYGQEAFTVEVLEVLEEKDDFLFDMSDEVKRMEKKWLQRLAPYGEHGYN